MRILYGDTILIMKSKKDRIIKQKRKEKKTVERTMHIEGMMRDAQDDRTREALRRCLDDLG